MRRIIKNFNLTKYNTFGIEAFADYFFAFTDIVELKSFLKNDLYSHLDVRVIGGGSNILLTEDFHGALIHPICKNIQVKNETNNSVTIKVDAGLNWDSLVEQCIAKGWYGLENLSGIPGSVGASPIQNIGAYGVEVKDFIRKVETVEIETQEIKIFDHDFCRFSYRDSIFKNEFKNKYVVTSVYFKLQKEANLVTHYANIDEELSKMGDRTPENLRQLILNIRQTKLPKVEEFPNAGSFFKNPVISATQFKKIALKSPGIPYYPDENESFKIPAAWLIDQCGYKGYQNGKVAVHDKQALVLINKGGACGQDILNLAKKITTKVKSTFGVDLEREVNLLP
jgi:UDP-N-acetylmuramate dehydrogenase